MNQTVFITDEQKWQAVINCAKKARGHFYYGVQTTGIFCHPDCASRTPNQDNVVFFKTADEAVKNGYRPCKRCRPDGVNANHATEQIITQACRQIEQAEHPLTLSQLANKASLSVSYFQRLFKKNVGVTPKQYAQMHHSKRLKTQLQGADSVTNAIYEAGYRSPSRVYDARNNVLAMSPSVFKKGAVGVEISYGIDSCFLGWILVAATERGVCAIEFADNQQDLRESLRANFPNAFIKKGNADFVALIQQVLGMIEQPQTNVTIELDIQGTAFQHRVWQILRQIKPGETLSYTQVAERLGSVQSVRAVASACAANKLAVAIPCHRVVAKNGAISGYRWGVERKVKLLAKEAKKPLLKKR